MGLKRKWESVDPPGAPVHKFLEYFQDRLREAFPQEHFSQIYGHFEILDRSNEIKGDILQELMREISLCPVYTICEIIKKICSGIEDATRQIVWKNHEYVEESISHMKKMIASLCEEYHASIRSHLATTPDMNPASIRDFIEARRNEIFRCFDGRWKPGKGWECFQQHQRDELCCELDRLEKSTIQGKENSDPAMNSSSQIVKKSESTSHERFEASGEKCESVQPSSSIDKGSWFTPTATSTPIKGSDEESTAYIEVTVKKFAFHDHDIPDLKFRLSTDTELGKLKRAYSNKTGIPNSTIRYTYDGRHIFDDETPKRLKMQNNDEIEVYRNVGGNTYVEWEWKL